MLSEKILILGATGFVGRNIYEILISKKEYIIKGTSRKQIESFIKFDIEDEDTWGNCSVFNPDIIIDASGYGIVKYQNDIEKLYDINYRKKKRFFDFINKMHPSLYWIQIGTAFEYDLKAIDIDENAPCCPDTHYGISKYMFSNFLESGQKKNFIILRPFGMFGKYEDDSKFFPFIINAQKNNERVNLSSGLQKRDYFFVEDLAEFIAIIIKNRNSIARRKINIGSNRAYSLRKIANILSVLIENFDEKLWNWNNLEQRINENDIFFNHSNVAEKLGFKLTPLEEALKKTISYYYKLK